MFNLSKFATRYYVRRDGSGNVIEQKQMDRGRPPGPVWEQVDEEGQPIAPKPQKIKTFEPAATATLPGKPSFMSTPFSYAPPDRSFISAPQEQVDPSNVAPVFEPTAEMRQAIGEFIKANIGRVFTKQPSSNVFEKDIEEGEEQASGLKQQQSFIPLPFEWRSPPIKLLIAKMAWGILAEQGGAAISLEQAQEFIGTMLGDATYGQVPPGYEDKFNKELASEPEAASGGDIHAQQFESLLEDSKGNENTIPLWQAYINFENVGEGIYTAIRGSLSDATKYRFFMEFPKSLESKSLEGSTINTNMGAQEFTNLVNNPKESRTRKILDKILTEKIAEVFDPSREVPDISHLTLDDLTDKEDHTLTDLEKYILRKASAYGSETGQRWGAPSQFSVNPETGGDVDFGEKAKVKDPGQAQENVMERSGLIHDLMYINEPTIKATQAFTNSFASAVRDWAEKKGKKNLYARLGLADILESMGNIASNNFADLVQSENRTAVSERLTEAFGENVASFAKEGLKIQFVPGARDETGRVLSWEMPSLWKLTSDDQVDAEIKRVIAEKNHILEHFNYRYKSLLHNAPGETDIDEDSFPYTVPQFAAPGGVPGAVPGAISEDVISQFTRRLNMGQPGREYSKEFIRATLMQGTTGLDWLMSQTREGVEAKGPQYNYGRHGPRAQAMGKIVTFLPYLAESFENKNIDPNVARVFFSLMGMQQRTGIVKPLNLNENGDVVWIDKMDSSGKAIKDETGLPIKIPQLDKHSNDYQKFPYYYQATKEPITPDFYKALERSGLLRGDPRRPSTPKRQKMQDANGNLFIAEKLPPLAKLDIDGTILPFQTRNASLIVDIMKNAIQKLNTIKALKRAMFKTSSIDVNNIYFIENLKYKLLSQVNASIRKICEDPTF